MVGKVVRYPAKHAIWNLLTGADAEQTSSSGRRAIDFAKENDRDGSHQEVIELLEAFCFKQKTMKNACGGEVEWAKILMLRSEDGNTNESLRKLFGHSAKLDPKKLLRRSLGMACRWGGSLE